MMDFEWDDAKNAACLTNRGFDFEFATLAFEDEDRVVLRGRRVNYGEERFRLLGAIGGRVFVVIYTMRGSVTRIISARKAKKKEVREYEHHPHPD